MFKFPPESALLYTLSAGKFFIFVNDKTTKNQ